MAQLSPETDLFKSQPEDSAVVFFIARRNPVSQRTGTSQDAADIVAALEKWSENGWRTSIAQMFGDTTGPEIYETGFTSDVDIAGVWEAPTLIEAHRGISEVQALGWEHFFATEWTVGPREFQPVPSTRGRTPDAPWGFFALWEWNDAWQSATREERAAYDQECDEAFLADVHSGISIAGRHRLDGQSRWHHLGLWEAPAFDLITQGMLKHEQVADFKFTTSRHYIGRRRSAVDYFRGIH